jgi:hypothetical protein
MYRYSIAAVLVATALIAGLAGGSVAVAQEPDRTDNKLVIWGVPSGYGIKVAQADAEFPRGPGDLPGLDGSVQAYAPLNRTSTVHLVNRETGTGPVIATIHPTSTWPDTTLNVQYAQGFPNVGLASPLLPAPQAAPALAPPPPLWNPSQGSFVEPERDGDNKLLVTGIPQGWAVHVAQPGSEFPRGEGNLPDGTGTATAYAPLDKVSHVYVWDPIRSRFSMIATVRPTATWPDTVVNAPVGLVQGFSAGLASPMQTIPGEPYVPVRPNFTPSQQVGRQYTVQRGDSLGVIAQQYGTTVAQLAALNNISNPSLIYPGQVLLLP